MEQTTLGRHGLRVSRLWLGAMTFGRETDEAESRRILDRYVDAGGTVIDTADGYGAGASEEIVGRWLAGRPRHDVVIATKAWFPTREGPNASGLSRAHLVEAVDASLRRLGTDHIDLYQAHLWDDATPLEETLGTFETLVAAGKVRYVGLSNVTGWQLQRAVDLARERGWVGIASLQAVYNLLDRELEWELLPVSRNEGVGVVVWSPLRGGWLTGKHRREQAAEGSRVAHADAWSWTERWDNYAHERTWRVLDALRAVADDVGRTPAQVALAWLLTRPGVTAPILGARTLAQLEENLGAIGWELDPEHAARLDEASAVPAPYPYRMIADLQPVGR
jgi:aryl-alcohol dehydrogenase-like predicted oxidoreductase